MSQPTVKFFVPGTPVPGGSKRAFLDPNTRQIRVKDDAKGNKEWRSRVAFFARQAHHADPLSGPLSLQVRFVMARPGGHYGTGRNAGRLRPSAPDFPAVKPDTTKLLRALEDALTGVLWRDDAQVVTQYAAKRYGPSPGADVIVRDARAVLAKEAG